jgi:hypothetical protein
MTILKNSIKCLSCGEVLESTNRKKLKECWCGLVTIAGGLERLTRYSVDPNSYEELSITKEDINVNVKKEI